MNRKRKNIHCITKKNISLEYNIQKTKQGVCKFINLISSSTFLYGYLAMTFEMSSKWLKKSINYFLLPAAVIGF